MSIRLINTTTKLPIDKIIESVFLQTIHPLYRKAVESTNRQTSIDIFFVDDKELDRELDNLQRQKHFLLDNERRSINSGEESIEVDASFDLMGVYFTNHPKFNRSVIKVSPEKVMLACISFKKVNSKAMPLSQLYPTLLIAVVIHELAHWIMDSNYHAYNGVFTWQWYVKELDNDLQYDFLNRNQRSISASANYHPSWQTVIRFIEESLANAFVLRQKLNRDERDFLCNFIEFQPPGYHHCYLWSEAITALLKTADSWAYFKRVEGFEHPTFPVEELINRLKSVVTSVPRELIDKYTQYTKIAGEPIMTIGMNDTKRK